MSVAVFLATVGTVLGASEAGESTGRAIELLDDTRFERGFLVWDPAPGKHVGRGTLRPTDGLERPAWGLAQWHSRFSLAGAEAEPLASGAVRFFDGAKAVTFRLAEHGGADLVLALDARTEYEGRAPAKGATWPHLLVERDLLARPALSELEAVPLRLSCRLLKSETSKPPGWDGRRHVAQFVFYLTVQNHNRRSPGYGDYLWFGLLLYDTRHRIPPGYAALDRGTAQKQGTGKFIYQPAGTRYTEKSLHDGDWTTIDTDLLPLIREGLDTAWQRGYLVDSRDPADYRLSGMNMGWEVTGPFDVAVAVKDQRLEALLEER
jgi:hypothetical protein